MVAGSLKRLASALLLLLGATAVSFVLGHLAPGSPARLLLGIDAPQAAVDAMNAQLGLDRPLLVQYGDYVWNVLHGDLGRSYSSSRSVGDLIADRAEVTAWLLTAGLTLSILLSVTLATLAARYRGTWVDTCIRAFTVASIAVPTFWSGLMLVRLIALPTGWLPVGGFGETLLEHVQSIVLPAITLGIFLAPMQVRVLRTNLVESLGSGYVEAAASRGVPRGRLLTRHALPNAAAPAIAIVSVQAGYLLFGAVMVENTFQLPGLGSSLVLAVNQRDYPMINGITLLFAVVVISFSLIADALSALVDPRVRAA
ncbi:ABC transporter permease [Saccharopolyspora spinosa]|uniref:Peptide/nickel transport system permease protein n=1 Tax=Saccharopolyspora spinosa TaxID=60894 RepID=A0A2N3XXU8_SACSN|nr:ABC transporter permease [Saccharopolyspora spinosa]PKW15459.1 peptide/nickel transport system permease protein [Saccharopolyspora spinosa]